MASNARSSTHAADAALHPADGAMRAHHLQLGRVVLEGRADFLALELVVLVAPDGDRRAKRFECARQPLGAGAERQRMAPRRQLQRAAFDDGDAVLGVVVAVAGADVRLRLRSMPRRAS